MEYRVELSDQAESELDAAYLFLSQKSSEAAFAWYGRVRTAIDSLSTLPRRCPLARENDFYPDIEVRQLLYGVGRGTYRVLFTVFDDDAEVRVLRFHYGAQRTRRPAQEQDDE